jgi:hypothetical protein
MISSYGTRTVQRNIQQQLRCNKCGSQNKRTLKDAVKPPEILNLSHLILCEYFGWKKISGASEGVNDALLYVFGLGGGEKSD